MMTPLAAGAVSGAAKQTTPEGMAPVTRPTKLFIGGITRNTTTKQLRDHFSAYGRVLDCVAMRQPDGRPRGFGYVTLDSPQAADLCLAQPQIIDGRVVDMKRAVPEGDMDSAPTTRLHTPGSARVQPPGLVQGKEAKPAQPRARGNAWPLPTGLNTLAAVTPQVWTGISSAPDCLELLSRTEAETPRCQQPDIGKACALSANAPEFVPQPVARPALGEITNMVHLQGEGKKSIMPLKDVKGSSHRDRDLQINTDSIYEDLSDSNPSPPGLASPYYDADLKTVSLGALPSLGSLEHAAGTCKRCNFYPKGRCQNGLSCSFCHLSHERRKSSRAEKRERAENMPQTPSTGTTDVEDLEANGALPFGLPVPDLSSLGLPFGMPAPVVPPPGLTPSLLSTQPLPPVWRDDDLENACHPFPNPLSLASAACLATVPMTANVPPSSPMTVLLQSHLEEAERKVMVTMATQTGEDSDSDCFCREKLLQHRSSGSGMNSLGFRTDKVGTADETPGAV
ncbi:unnamed protein product [Durusdinium trenchii]|uniref:Uncharacterized protein n=1 Tax=Durusdinium trenchii TaxID=1381693 RepID=A0ABP0J889_9DINO